MFKVGVTVNKLTIKTREVIKLKKYDSNPFSTRVVHFNISLNENGKLIFKEDDDNIQVIFELRTIMKYFMNLYLFQKDKIGLIDSRYKINRALPGVEVDICFTIYNINTDSYLKLTYTNKNNKDSGFFYLDYIDVMVIDAFLGKIVNSCVLDHSPKFDSSEWYR